MNEVLLIEDNLGMQLIVRMVLEPAFRLTTVSTLAEGAKILDESDFDVVILDLHLPDGEGLDFLRNRKQDGRNGRTPVLLFTGSSEDRVAIQGEALGAKGFVQKPFDPKDLKTKVQGLASGRS